MKTLTILFCSYFLFCYILLIHSSNLKNKNLSLESPQNPQSISFRDILFRLVTQTFFNSIDTNKDGSITSDEFTKFSMKAHGSSGTKVPNEADIKTTFTKMDANHQGRINFTEFCAWFKSESAQGGREADTILDIASQVTFDKLDMHHNKELTGTQFVTEIQEFAKNNELGDIKESLLRGIFYKSLKNHETSFRERHFNAILRHELVLSVAPSKAKAKPRELPHISNEEEVHEKPKTTAQTIPRTPIDQIIEHMLVHNLFNSIDTDNNGKITFNEFLQFYRQFSYSHGWDTPITLDIKYLFTLIDTDRSGTVTIDELNTYMTKAQSSGQNFKLFAKIASTISFERLDKDRSGTLSEDEFRKGLTDYAKGNNLHVPELHVIQEVWKSLIKKERELNINDFHTLVSSIFAGGDHIISGSTKSAPERLREILSSLLIGGFIKSIDRNNIGTINLNQFTDFMKRLTKQEGLLIPSDASLKVSFQKVDQDKSGAVTHSELSNFLRDRLKSGESLGLFVEIAAKSIFRSFDLKITGDLSVEEFRSIIQTYAQRNDFDAPSDEALNSAWRHAIGNQNKFSTETFLHLISSQFGLIV